MTEQIKKDPKHSPEKSRFGEFGEGLIADLMRDYPDLTRKEAEQMVDAL